MSVGLGALAEEASLSELVTLLQLWVSTVRVRGDPCLFCRPRALPHTRPTPVRAAAVVLGLP